MKKRRFFIYLFSVFALAVLFSGVILFIKSSTRMRPPIETESTKVMILEKFVFTNEKDGRIDWKIRADKAKKVLDQEEIEVKEIEGEYEPSEGIFVSFKGKEGKIDTSKGICFVFEPDILYNKLYRFRTSEVNIDFKNGIAKTDKPLSIVGAKLSLKGTGLLGKLKDGVIDIEKTVTGSVNLENGSYIFRSEKFTYNVKKDAYLFEGNVKIEGSDINMSCSRVFIFNRDGVVERMEAEGEVSLKMEKMTARSGSMVYDFKEEKIFLRDSPIVTKDDMNTRGDVIIYDKKNENFYVKGSKLKIEKEKR